ncbi:HD-GYP domain-containing protein [Candidatus Nitrospira bockiana]
MTADDASVSALDRLFQSMPPSDDEALRRLTVALRTHDPRAYAHGIRTAEYAVGFAHRLGLSGTALVELHLAAVFHDIGRLTLPPELREKDGPLTAEEYAAIQSHPRAAMHLLAPFSFLRGPALLIAHHHEHWDGSGYPYGLRRELIPYGSRILAVTDMFETLLSQERPDARRTPSLALRMLHSVAGSQLDPSLVPVFEAWVGEHLHLLRFELTGDEVATGQAVPPAHPGGSPRSSGLPPFPSRCGVALAETSCRPRHQQEAAKLWRSP